MPADVCPHSSKQVANCWCDAKMCLVKQKKKTTAFGFGALTGNDFMFFLTRWLEISSLFEFWQPESVFQKHHQQKAQKKKNLNVYSRISVKSDRQKTLNPEEGTTNALSTIYQMLHVFFPLNYNLKKKNKKTNSLKWQMCLCEVFLSLSHFKWWKLPPSPATTVSESSLQKRP